jgi:hypothetical protein
LVELDEAALDFDGADDFGVFWVDVEAGFGSMLTPFSLIRSAYEPRALKTEGVFCSAAGEVGIVVAEVEEGIMRAWR